MISIGIKGKGFLVSIVAPAIEDCAKSICLVV